MKFKEIKPGMVIHCPTEEDARALLEYLKELGYTWVNKGDLTSVNYWTRYGESTVYYLNDKKHVTFSSVIKADEIEHNEITEFSDLIEPDKTGEKNIGESIKNLADVTYKGIKKTMDGVNRSMFFDGNDDWGDWNYKPDKNSTEMSAVEVLEWLCTNEDKDDVFRYTFGQGYPSIQDVFDGYMPEEIIQRITAYEAEKMKPKPVEVEHGKLLYVSVRDADSGRYQNYSEFEYWPDKQAESYETVKATFLSEVARETQKTARTSEYDICRVKEGEA